MTKSTLYLFILLAVGFNLNCTGKKRSPKKIWQENECGCQLTTYELNDVLPILASADSIKICKPGTMIIAGDTMTWPQFLQSKYLYTYGKLFDCHKNVPVALKYPSNIIRYKNKNILIDYRFGMEVYDSVNRQWMNVDIETYRQEISSKKSTLQYSGLALIFKVPRQGKSAFRSTEEDYTKLLASPRHDGLSRTMLRLFLSAANGDKVSEARFVSFPVDFKDDLNRKPALASYYNQYLKLYRDHQNSLAGGGKMDYYDLSQFPYFKDPKQFKKTQEYFDKNWK